MRRAPQTPSQALSTASSSGSRGRPARILKELHNGEAKELVLDHLFDDTTGLPLLLDRSFEVNALVTARESSDAPTQNGISTIDEFLGALKESENVESVSLSLDLRDRPCGLALQHAALSLPNLRELHLRDDAAKPAYFAGIAPSLAPHQLRVLSLSQMALPSQNDVLQLSFALRGLSGLSVIRVHDMEIGRDGGFGSVVLDESSVLMNEITLDPLLDSLSMLRQLESLELSCAPQSQGKESRSTRLVSDASLTRLFQRLDHLSDISLWSLGIDALHMDSLKCALRAHPRLTFLSLRRNDIDWRAFERDVLLWNTNLCHVYGDFSERDEDRITLWLLLNRLGRGHALTSMEQERSWLELFEVVREDPSLLYALLISDPGRLMRWKK